MPKQTTLNQVTLCADGSIGVQLLKRFIDPESGAVIMEEPHRGTIDLAEASIDPSIDAINAHLIQMGYPAISEAETERIRQVDAVARADAGIKAVRQQKLALREQ